MGWRVQLFVFSPEINFFPNILVEKIIEEIAPVLHSYEIWCYFLHHMKLKKAHLDFGLDPQSL